MANSKVILEKAKIDSAKKIYLKAIDDAKQVLKTQLAKAKTAKAKKTAQDRYDKTVAYALRKRDAVYSLAKQNLALIYAELKSLN